MSEEIQNPSLNVPRSLLTSIIINGILGFGMLIAVLFCLGDPDAAFATPTRYPFMEIFASGVGVKGGTAMASLVILLGISAVIGSLTSSSRMTWAFARDRGLPFWKQLSIVRLIPQLQCFSFSDDLTSRAGRTANESSARFNRRHNNHLMSH